jgi:ferric-dicitrate binding protein FerR (iron transport regulator)
VTRERDHRGPDARPQTGDEAPLDPRAAELFDLARSALGEMTPARSQRGWARLRSRSAPRARRGRWLVAASLGAVAGAAIVLGPRLLRPEAAALTFEVQGGAIAANGAIHATENGAPALKFVDGTVIKLAPGSSGRLGEVDDRGAHVAIDDGSALVNVVPKPRARWVVDAGPFRIAVHGTVFTAAWDRARGRLDVRLEHGLVSVTGPVAVEPIPMHTGQHLTVSLQQKKVVLRPLDAVEVQEPLGEGAPTTAPPSAAQSTAVAPAPGMAPLPARPAHAARPAARSWTAELAAGHFDAILEDAGRDLTRALSARPTDELAALADAARYRRRDDVADRALLAQRRRFPGTVRATDAAFFLGRLSENKGAAGQAVRWYDQYLTEAPDGPYAADALGRKMVAVRDLRGEEAARDLADEYLRRFPRGSYAGAASALRGGR